MFSNLFLGIFSSLWGMFKGIIIFLLKFLVLAFVPLLTACIVYVIYYKIKGFKAIKNELVNVKEPNLFYKLFIQLPRQIVLDYYTLDPNIFKEYGFYMVVGEQGSGKSMTMAYLMDKWQKTYPRLKVYTNMGYHAEDGSIKSLGELTLSTNGVYGVVNALDEVQSFLGTEYSLKFPEHLKEIICQQRKVRRCILGGTQNFESVAKPIRQQCRYIFYPVTFFGCFTVVSQYKCHLDKDYIFDRSKEKPIKRFCFVHNEHLRTIYDSYKTVDKISLC